MGEGVRNKSADKIKREDRTWSDGSLESVFEPAEDSFERLKCQSCGAVNRFEILVTNDYETTARCSCGMYYIVHTG